MPLSADELQQLVAPIALYPDALVAQVLGAATFPDQVACDSIWLQQNKNLTDTVLMQAVDKQPWDPSVKALTQFPSVFGFSWPSCRQSPSPNGVTNSGGVERAWRALDGPNTNFRWPSSAGKQLQSPRVNAASQRLLALRANQRAPRHAADQRETLCCKQEDLASFR